MHIMHKISSLLEPQKIYLSIKELLFEFHHFYKYILLDHKYCDNEIMYIWCKKLNFIFKENLTTQVFSKAMFSALCK